MRPRRPQTDVDRFLEEVRRRREGKPAKVSREEEEVGTVLPVEEIPTAQPVPRARAVPPPLPVEAVGTVIPVARRPLREQPAPPPPQGEEIIVAKLVSGPQEAARPTGPPTAGPPPLLPQLVGTRGHSPAILQLLQLLRTPRSLGTAVLLREIFEAPLSRRTRPGRGGRA